MKKVAFIIACAILFLPSYSLSAEEKSSCYGQYYQLIPTKNRVFLIDTRTGETWIYSGSEGDIKVDSVFVRVPFMGYENLKEYPNFKKFVTKKPSGN